MVNFSCKTCGATAQSDQAISVCPACGAKGDGPHPASVQSVAGNSKAAGFVIQKPVASERREHDFGRKPAARTEFVTQKPVARKA
jgi:hypothetical protein